MRSVPAACVVPSATMSVLNGDEFTLPIGVLVACASMWHGLARRERAGAINPLSPCKPQKNLLITPANERRERRQLPLVGRGSSFNLLEKARG